MAVTALITAAVTGTTKLKVNHGAGFELEVPYHRAACMHACMVERIKKKLLL